MHSIWLCSRSLAIGNIAVIIAAAGFIATPSLWPDLVVTAIIASLDLSAAIHVIPLAFREVRA